MSNKSTNKIMSNKSTNKNNSVLKRVILAGSAFALLATAAAQANAKDYEIMNSDILDTTKISKGDSLKYKKGSIVTSSTNGLQGLEVADIDFSGNTLANLVVGSSDRQNPDNITIVKLTGDAEVNKFGLTLLLNEGSIVTLNGDKDDSYASPNVYIVGSGILNLEGAKYSGRIGESRIAPTNALDTVNVTKGDVVLRGESSAAKSFMISDKASLTLENKHKLTGDISSAKGDTKLILKESSVKGNIGTEKFYLGAVNVQDNVVLDSDKAIYAKEITIEKGKTLENRFAAENLFLDAKDSKIKFN